MDSDSSQPDSPPTTTLSVATLESLIKTKLAKIDELRQEGASLSEMVNDFLDNNQEFAALQEAAKQAAQAKTAKKKELLGSPDIKSTADKLKENKASLKEIRASLSNDLYQFHNLSGENHIELEGDLRQIVYTAKLVKRSTQG